MFDDKPSIVALKRKGALDLKVIVAASREGRPVCGRRKTNIYPKTPNRERERERERELNKQIATDYQNKLTVTLLRVKVACV